jgi:transposase-like protein
MSATRRRKTVWNERKIASFRQMIEGGYDLLDIAARFSLSPTAVYYWADKFGVEIRTPRRRNRKAA